MSDDNSSQHQNRRGPQESSMSPPVPSAPPLEPVATSSADASFSSTMRLPASNPHQRHPPPGQGQLQQPLLASAPPQQLVMSSNPPAPSFSSNQQRFEPAGPNVGWNGNRSGSVGNGTTGGVVVAAPATVVAMSNGGMVMHLRQLAIFSRRDPDEYQLLW